MNIIYEKIEEKKQVLLIISLLMISIVMEIYFIFILNIEVVFSHFFYIPIILACLWWKKKGMVIPLILAILLITLSMFNGNIVLDINNLDNLLRALLFIIIGFVVAILSENISKSESERLQIMTDLERSNIELQQFAYVASHDLQEPLRAIISFSQLLIDDYHNKFDNEAKDYLNYIIEGGGRMKILISDLLNYSRISRYQKPLKKCPFQIIIDDVLFNLMETILETGAVITFDPLPTLKVDKVQMIQLFQNLIGNSIKFHREDPPKIHIDAIKKQNDWLFSVKDNGIGIETKYFDRIFQIFQRLNTRDEYSGSGIGLAICRRIIERYGGKIWVESKLNEGTTFYFTIPLKN